jgi:hypothetical protein
MDPRWIEHEDPIVLQDKCIVQWEIVKKTCKLLGVEHPHDLDTPVRREGIVMAGKHLETIAKDLNETFGLRVKVNRHGCEDKSVRRGVELTNAVLRSWGFTVLRTSRKMKRVEGKRVDVGEFSLQFHDNRSKCLIERKQYVYPEFLSDEDENQL